ncbi:ABC transporter permease subunit [Paenibacillus sp. Marseille-P2973]|uniref:ABC transporter permease n=1 Tax=Paenibacillus sp. Marseille-P2973 TaxID=1871032 RepID=UPI001B384909|nr:ABC transporter permease subunit [Paenibacillus sp. Marseille-P2973]MBQ4898041.1 ABC transporter permease subunit [Paenibacillus sp. Marseille-P2973]
MSDMLQVAKKEIKIGFRNPWAYSFLILFSVFSLSLLLVNSQNEISGYSGVTGSMLSLTLYLLPLMSLFLGSFSLTAEKEEGSWQLLSTYPLGTISFMLGKYIGLSAVLLTIISFGYGLIGLITALIGKMFDINTYLLFLSFSCGLVLLFLTIALWIGSLAKNRWQALTISVMIWFFTVIAWPTILIAVLGLLPYLWIKPLLIIFTFLNPAEFVRLFVVIKLGGGAVLGPEYYKWVSWIHSSGGSFSFFVLFFIWLLFTLTCVCWIWERRRSCV